MINQKQFLYVLQNEKHYTTFSVDVEISSPFHQKLIDEFDWNILYDYENSIVKDIFNMNSNKRNMILNKQQNQFQHVFLDDDDLFDILKKEYINRRTI